MYYFRQQIQETKEKLPGQLIRQLGLFDSTMVMVGIVIGSGIFLTTGIMAKYIPSAGLLLLAWVVGGLLTLAGALTYAELGAALPLGCSSLQRSSSRLLGP